MMITRLYIAFFIVEAIAGLVGIPWPLLIPPLLMQRIPQVVPVVAVLGSWSSRIQIAPSMSSVLRHLQAPPAVVLFWLAGISFALGQANQPATRVEAALMPAEIVPGPPIVVPSTEAVGTDEVSSGPVRNTRSTRTAWADLSSKRPRLNLTPSLTQICQQS